MTDVSTTAERCAIPSCSGLPTVSIWFDGEVKVWACDEHVHEAQTIGLRMAGDRTVHLVTIYGEQRTPPRGQATPPAERSGK